MNTPLQVVDAIYAAFGRGDIPAILEHLDAQVRWDAWEDNHAQRAGVPWLLPRTGHAGAVEFFNLLATTMTFREFSVLSMMAGGDQVAVEVRLDAALQNGQSLRDEEIHLWTFGDDGKVVRFRHYSDTAKHMAAAGLAR
jgi:uncharacterized protein